MRERTCIIREVRRIQHLDTCMLSTMKEVTIGAVAPGSQPRLNGTLALLNHSPR